MDFWLAGVTGAVQYAGHESCDAEGLGPGLLLVWLATRLSSATHESLHSSANASTIGTVALLFGLFAAFLANDIWVRNQMAHQAVIDEGDAIRNLARLSEGQNPEYTLMLRNALVDYAKVVIDQDSARMLGPSSSRRCSMPSCNCARSVRCE
jgi:hypothetical protein